jgi:hypothetical protein
MAEDKRVRISADLTPLRQLREEAVSLYRDIDQVSSSNQQMTERNIQQLREQLSLMEDRNELERLLIDLKRQAAAIATPTPTPTRQIRETQQNFVYDQETNSITWDLTKQPTEPEDTKEIKQLPSEEVEGPRPKKKKKPKKKKIQEDLFEGVTPEYDEETNALEWRAKPKKETVRETTNETLREINRHVENIDNSVTKVDNTKTIEDNREETVDNSRRYENNREDITENVKNIERNVININENTAPLKEKDPVEAKPDFISERREIRQEDIQQPQRREVREERVVEQQKQEVFSDENILKAISSLESAFEKGIQNIGELLKSIEKENSAPNASQSAITRYLEALTNSISLIEDNVDQIETAVVEVRRGGGGNQGGGPTIIPPTQPTSSSGSDAGIMAMMGSGMGSFLKFLGGAAILNSIKNTVTDRYFRNQEAALRAEYQGTVETGASYRRVQAANEADMYRWIPIIGDIIARGIEMPANIAADRMIATVQKYMEAETKFAPYAQTFGGRTSDVLGIASKEGSYAANALGIDIGTYIQRRTELTRAAGGRVPGATEEDPTARREAQSLMAAERLYGISPSAINRLQGSLRFGDENTSYGGSAIIREFERGMKELSLPFSEIASTMEESLETFNKRADEILSKAGEFDAGRILAVMNGIRTATGLQGRQLERVQTAFSGGGISQDEITQALLLRTLTSTDPNVRTYSEAMERLEAVRSGNADPEFMRDFLLQLQGLSQNNEQFINILKGVFPNLSWNDIRSQFAEGDPTTIINRIYDKVDESFKRIREQPREGYEPEEAARTVGAGARMTASDTNRQIGQGAESMLEVLQAIRDGVNSIDGKLGEDWKNYLDAQTGQLKNLADVVSGKTDIDTGGKKSSMLLLMQMASWTKLMNRFFSLQEDKR